MNHVSYVPGEIAFPSLPTGTAFLKSQVEFLGVTDLTYLNHVVKLLQLDPSASLKRMSKGMKQKTAIAAALMGDKEILVLDEPTTGLDRASNTRLDAGDGAGSEDRKSTRLNSSHLKLARMPSSA